MIEEINPEDQDIEYVSKTQLKKESHELQDFGKQLVALKPQQLASFELPDSLAHAIAEAHKILNKRSALKRQYQYIGKILRNIDIEPIQKQFYRLQNQAEINNHIQHQAEYWREQILLNGDTAINQFLESITVDCDRQQLRQIYRNANAAKKEAQKLNQTRQLYQVLFAALKENDELHNTPSY